MCWINTAIAAFPAFVLIVTGFDPRVMRLNWFLPRFSHHRTPGFGHNDAVPSGLQPYERTFKGQKKKRRNIYIYIYIYKLKIIVLRLAFRICLPSGVWMFLFLTSNSDST